MITKQRRMALNHNLWPPLPPNKKWTLPLLGRWRKSREGRRGMAAEWRKTMAANRQLSFKA